MKPSFILCAQSFGPRPSRLVHEVKLGLEQIGLEFIRDLPPLHEGLWQSEWSGTPAIDHRLVLRALSVLHKTDLALIPDVPERTQRKLVVFDMDSTLINGEVINELARVHGVASQVEEITQRAMNGELDFTQSLHARVALLAGLSINQLTAIEHSLPMNPGVAQTIGVLKLAGIKTAIVTGGFTFFAKALGAKLGVDHVFANELSIHDAQLTGQVTGVVIDGAGKARVLTELAQQYGLTLSQTVAVGDGANDLPMLLSAGLGVAYHAKESVRRQSPSEISQGDMSVLLSYLGLGAKVLA